MGHMVETHVTIARQDDTHAVAKARDHFMILNIKKGSGEGGFTAAETVLAALGACLLTNVNAISQKMRLKVEDARIEFDSQRRDVPPALTEISYRLILKSEEPEDKLQELHDLCIKWGTVTNTLINGITPHGELVVEK